MSASERINWNKMCRPLRFFEGVPHHTSDSEETRSTTIKGHSVYLNLPSSAHQMFQSFSFISSHKLCFAFLRASFLVGIMHGWGKKKSTFSCWRGGEAKFEHLFNLPYKACWDLRLCRETDFQPPCPGLMKTSIALKKNRGTRVYKHDLH